MGLAVLAMVASAGCAGFGAVPSGERLERMARAPNFDGRQFRSESPRDIDGSYALAQWLRGAPDRQPTSPPPIEVRTADDYAAPPASGLRVTWLGHAATLLELDGEILLTDPHLSERSSPFRRFGGPTRFFPSPISAADLPPLSAIVISHDHFDHLDHTSVLAIERAQHARWIVPLGVGAHLARWGVDEDWIEELAWWEEAQVGSVRVVALPSRHSSGRSPGSLNRTLWASWAFVGPAHRVFFSGDTTYADLFHTIGERLGPFDLTMIEIGAYNPAWADAHLGPEQAALVHLAVRGDRMLPIHWGTFNLALHPWTEPIERLRWIADLAEIPWFMPRPGQPVEPMMERPVAAWWPSLPWSSSIERPQVASDPASPRLPSGVQALPTRSPVAPSRRDRVRTTPGNPRTLPAYP